MVQKKDSQLACEKVVWMALKMVDWLVYEWMKPLSWSLDMDKGMRLLPSQNQVEGNELSNL